MAIASARRSCQTETEGRAAVPVERLIRTRIWYAKVFGDYRETRKVTVFGSARTMPDNPLYQMARQFGQNLAAAGFMVINGGGPGIKQAANEGPARKNPSVSASACRSSRSRIPF